MNTYLVIKWLHIVSSVLLAGTGFGSAFYLFFANRSGSLAAQAVVARLVKRADLWFTTPAVIVQPVTGVWLAMTAIPPALKFAGLFPGADSPALLPVMIVILLVATVSSLTTRLGRSCS